MLSLCYWCWIPWKITMKKCLSPLILKMKIFRETQWRISRTFFYCTMILKNFSSFLKITILNFWKTWDSSQRKCKTWETLPPLFLITMVSPENMTESSAKYPLKIKTTKISWKKLTLQERASSWLEIVIWKILTILSDSILF